MNVRRLLFLLIAVSAMDSVLAQPADGFKFQAVMRDAAGQLKVRSDVALRISIVEGSIDGPSVYSEDHLVRTNDIGVVNLVIGQGAAGRGSFVDINWASASFFVKISVDGVPVGASQLLSVPYAKYAVKAGNGFSGRYSDLEGKPALAVVATTGRYDDLAGSPVIPVIDDEGVNSNALWSSKKVADSLSVKLDARDAQGKLDGIVTKLQQLEGIVLNLRGFIPTSDSTGKLADIDGNIYKAVRIGEQWWMAENLRTTHFQDGTALVHTDDPQIWDKLRPETRGEVLPPVYTYYDNDIENSSYYGNLYKHLTAVDARQLCPTGWHLPSRTEWTEMIDHLGGASAAVKKLKAYDPNPLAKGWAKSSEPHLNESGFSALPGGFKAGGYSGLGKTACWWMDDPLLLFNLRIENDIRFDRPRGNEGFSIRCIKD